MSDYYFSANIDNETTLCISPLTDKKLAVSGQSVEDASGYFLYENRYSDEVVEVRIIARLVSEEAALQMRHVLNMD